MVFYFCSGSGGASLAEPTLMESDNVTTKMNDCDISEEFAGGRTAVRERENNTMERGVEKLP